MSIRSKITTRSMRRRGKDSRKRAARRAKVVEARTTTTYGKIVAWSLCSSTKS